ncbi:PLxRFG domain-containing protein, partial [Comamonas testosteroni]|uniref:PLxRFG domain-containing protein n=1 Tax=Comamonas testosteroni TaxID=285 RepID=UPI0012D7BA31
MAKKKTPPPRALSSFDDLDAAGIGAGYVSPFTPSDAPAADETPKSRGLLAVANDTVIEAANAAAGGLSSAANFIKPGNAVSGWIDKNIIQAGEESQSDVVKASKKKFREEVEKADGVMGELGAVGSYIAESPLLAAAQAAGSFVGPGAAVKGAGMAARTAGLGAKGIERAGRAGGVAAGAAMAGGDAAGTAYDLAIKAGATEEEATAAARQASVIPALVGGAGGAFGAEKLLAGAKGFGGGAAARAAKTGLSEAAQEAVEEGVAQYEGQRAAVPFDPSIDPSKGVAAAAGMGAALGGMTGAGTSLLTGGHAPVMDNALDSAINQPQLTVEQAQAAIDSVSNGSASPDQLALLVQLQADRTGQNNVSPIMDMDALQRNGVPPIGLLDEVALSREGLGAPAQVVPERGALSRAANLSAATQQATPLTTAAETQEQQQSAQPTEGADMEAGEISPEARVGRIQEHLDFLAQMGRSQGWTNEALAQRTALQQELDLLSPAQRMADLNDQAAEAEARAADWAGRQYRPNPTELPEHAVKGGPADIQEANEQRRLKNIQQAQQEAAAARAQVDQVEGEGNAQAQLAAQQDRATRAAQAAPDILNKQGKPFTVKLPAVKAAQAAGAGWEPVKLDGGYVVRQVQPTDSPAPAATKAAAPAVQEATAKAEEIAREGNAQRQQTAQADQDAGARWDAMQPDAQRAVLAAVPKMAKVIRQNLEGKAWEKMSSGNREKVLSAMNSEAASAQQQKKAEEKPIEGKDLGNGWAAFAPESGTKAVPRAQMPQIKAEHRGAMVNFMNARGIAHQEETVPAASLKPTQAEFSREKVQKALGYEGGDRSILVSQDGHVLDGHHQWMAAREQGKDVKTIRLDAPIERLLEAAHEFPSSSTSGGATDPKTADTGSGATFTPSVGTAVEITSGLYQGNSGTVESISDTGRVVVRGNNSLATGFATTASDLAPSAQQAPTSGQFPLADADRSYSGISRSGSRSAKADRDAFEQFMAKAEQSGASVATTEAQRQAASAALESLRTDYLAQYRSLMNTRSGAYSGFVVGRSNLNSKQANSRNAALDKAMERFDSWAGDNADRVRKAVLAARTPEQAKADRDKVAADIKEKAEKRAANLKAQLLKFLSFKSGESMPYGKNAIITRVSYDRDGYPSSLTFKMADGSPLTDDKVELVTTLKDRGETLAQAKARIRALVDEVRAENPQLNGGAGAIRAAALDKAAKPKSVPAKIAEAQAARADYFTPGNIVKSYGGHDRVIAYTAPDADGHWSVKVQAVRKEGDAWVNEPNESERTHSTPPDARQLKAGPVQAANSDAEQAASFRRSSADEAAGADFDVDGFLQAMNDGQPVAQARAQAVSAVQKTADAIRAGWANGPEVTVVYDMADPAIPAAARRADQAQRSGGADGDPEGFYYEGKAYLLASQLHTDKDVARVLMHEALGHHGLRGVFGTGLDSVLEQIVAVRRGDVRRKAAEYGLDYDKPAHRLQAAEEVLAEWAQSRPEMGFVRRAVAAIRSWLRQHVARFKNSEVTDNEIIRAYILPARGWVERGAGAGEQNAPSFSRGTQPELDTFAAEFMAELSGVDELFHNPIVHAGSAEAALRQIDPTIKFMGDVTAVDERQESGADTKLLFRTANGRDFYVFEKGDDFWLDVSRLDEGGGGNAIYSALMDYAASDNKVFIGDPAGLSDIAMRRRLEAMLSSAIKHGSTDHMQPHARQVQGDETLGIPALKWKQGDTIGNVQRMIDVSLAAISAYVPEFRRARYDFATGTFRNSQGLPLSDEDLRGWASEHPRMRAAGAGIRSIKRGILLNTLARAEGGQRPGLLAQVLRQPRQLVGPQAQGIFYSRSASDSVIPDAIIGSTLGSASSHPDYAAAKGGDIEAAVRLAKDLVTPELVAKVMAVIGDSKPLVVPVAAEEAAGRNKIPRASAEVLAQRLGLDTAFDIVQANRARRTGMDGLDRLFAPVDFEGAVEPGSYLLLDDTLTQGGTFAALASHIREGGGTVAGVIALTGKQYSAKIQPSAETLASLRQKHGDLENEFRAATGYGFDSLTESEARYLARYEPADRLRDRISEEGRRGRARQDQGDSGPGAVSDGPLFSRSRLADIKDSALTQLDSILSHPGKVSMWDKTVGTMRHLAERNPFFKPVYESAQQNIDDVSMLANDAADQAPRILPRVDSMGDILGKNRKRPVSAADNKAVARPLFEGTLLWARDINGQASLVEDLTKKYANLSVHNKAAMLLKAHRIDAGVLAMWQGLPAQQYEKLIDSRFESKILKAGVVWSDKELQSQFGATPDQISLYREARAAIDRSIDMTARADMMRTLGDEYAAMRDAVLEQPSMDSAAQLLLDMLEQDAKAVPDNRDRLAVQMQQIRKRLEDAKGLQESGYAPLSRFGRYTVDVVDAAGERQYFGMYETIREANTAARNFRLTFPDAKVEQGTMSQQAYKLFAGVTPESLELFGNMLGLDSEGNEAQDKAFQEYLKLTKNNHSALKRMIHRKGTSGFSEDVGRVVANFVYSNARQAAAGLNVGT